MRNQEKKIELQKKERGRTCVRGITFLPAYLRYNAIFVAFFVYYLSIPKYLLDELPL